MDTSSIETSVVLSVLMSEISEGVLVLDNRHHVLLSNTAAQKLLKFNPDGHSINELFLSSSCDNLADLNPGKDYILSHIHPERLEKYVAKVAHSDKTALGPKILIFSHLSPSGESHALDAKESLDKFVHIISHDLQEPLRGIACYADLLARKYTESLDDKSQRYLNYIVLGAKRMQAMIRDLLTLSRLPAQAHPFESIDLSELLESVLKNMSHHLKETDARIERSPLPTVSGDPQQMSMVFQSLVSNAIKYSGDSTPNLKISAEQSSDNKWTISFSDQGIGVDPINHTRIFDVFQRVNTKDKYNGTGMGLAMVDNIIRRHNGRCWVESALGHGATFCFSIPTIKSNPI